MSFSLKRGHVATAGIVLAGLVVAAVVAVQLFTPGLAHRVTGSHADAGAATTVDARLDRLERMQAEQFAQLSRQLENLSAGGVRGKPTPEQRQREQERSEHSRRMREDPSYERQVLEQRLAGLNQEFVKETVDHRWAMETDAFASDALASAARRVGITLAKSEVDCRSTTCRIRIDVDQRHNYEDIATYLMTDLAESLPNASYVVMPLENGKRAVNIYARKPGAN